jgi:hypothetical protein
MGLIYGLGVFVPVALTLELTSVSPSLVFALVVLGAAMLAGGCTAGRSSGLATPA